MRIFGRAVSGVLVVSLVLVSQQAIAAQPEAPAVSRDQAPHRSVGSRLDAPLAASKSKAVTRVPYRVPDQAAFARAKNAAAGRASGPTSYRGNDFAIGATPSSRTVVQGSSTTFTVNTQLTSGSGKPLSLSVSGLPAGATGTFNPASVQAGASSILTITTTSTAATGTVALTITGAASSPPTTHTASVSLTVTPLAVDDFSIAATPSSQGVLQGSSTTYNVTTQVTSGNAQTLALSLAGLPAGASGTFVPTSVAAGGSSTLTVMTSTSTPTGTFTLTITGAYASPPTTHSANVTVSVSAPVADDFSVSATPASRSVIQGQSTTYAVSTQVVSGVAQTVTLSLGGLPAGATGTFSPTAVTAGGSSTLTIVTSTTAATGTVTLAIAGAYASPPTTHTASVSFTVTQLPPDEFSMSASPLTQTVTQGASATYTVNTQITSGAAQSVSLSLSGLPAGATGSFNPATVTSGGGSVLTVATATSVAVGTYPLTITGQGAAGPSHSASVSLDVAAASSGPTIGVSWNGQFEADLAPPDPTGAMGVNSYIELINLRYGIYGRDGVLRNEGDLGQLTRFPVSELSDPQIVWDPTSQRYYYLVLDFQTSAYAFGYSKTADPRSDDEFCHYIIDAFYGPFVLPDYPKLAVTRDFVLVGSNVFLLFAFYMGSDVNWFVKPTDPVCPGQLGAGGTFSGLKNVDGSLMSTPEPAVALDTTSDGWVVGSNDVSTSGGANYLTVFKVTKNARGDAQLSAPLRVTVPPYQMPANAPQNGTTQLLDTMDTRLTHAVAGYDPRINATAIWTAHTVFGGAGAEVRWFEISTAGAPELAQTGTVTDPDLYVFNGAISSDRAADDLTTPAAVTGSDMVMGFNTSSAATFAAIKMVSQRGTAPQSGVVLVKDSPGPNIDFSCGSSLPDVCRWGDYGGASADPVTTNGGQVWFSNEWNEAATDGSTPVWRTWNWSARP
jgi:hypothetical protein